MPAGHHPPLEQGERRVLRVRSHPWLLVRSALPMLLFAVAPLLYIVLDEMAPGLRLAQLFNYFLVALAIAAGAYLVKWLAVDLLAWSQRMWVVTDRRVIAQSGLLAIRRRECPLSKIQESDYVSHGPVSRVLDIGDVKVQTMGALGPIVMCDVGHPRRLQAVISAQARAARVGSGRRPMAAAPDEVARQLEAVVSRGSGAAWQNNHSAATEFVHPIAPRAARVQQKLNLLPEEAVVAVTRQHVVVLAANLLLPMIAALLTVVAVLLIGRASLPVAGSAAVAIAAWSGWCVASFRAHEYVLTSDRLMELRSTPFVFQMRDIVQLAAVQDVTLQIPTIFGRLADIGDVVVEIAGPDERVVLSSVGRPSDIQKLIFETINERERRETQRNDQRLAATLSRWFQEYHKLRRGMEDSH